MYQPFSRFLLLLIFFGVFCLTYTNGSHIKHLPRYMKLSLNGTKQLLALKRLPVWNVHDMKRFTSYGMRFETFSDMKRRKSWNVPWHYTNSGVKRHLYRNVSARKSKLTYEYATWRFEIFPIFSSCRHSLSLKGISKRILLKSGFK